MGEPWSRTALYDDGPLMNTDEHGYFDALTERVLEAFFEVSNTLGAGFLEKVYQRALLHELLVEEALVISPANRPRS
jgi:PD-(D/E)XK nuclease superfamily